MDNSYQRRIYLDYSNERIEELRNKIKYSKGVTREPTITNTIDVPYSFIRNKELSSMEKVMYLYLCTFDGMECPSIREMAEDLGISTRTVNSTIKNLEHKKLVCKINRVIVGKSGQKEKGTNLYHLAGIDKINGTFKELDLETITKAYPDFIDYVYI